MSLGLSSVVSYDVSFPVLEFWIWFLTGMAFGAVFVLGLLDGFMMTLDLPMVVWLSRRLQATVFSINGWVDNGFGLLRASFKLAVMRSRLNQKLLTYEQL